MRLTPLDIKRQEFRKTFRGYDPAEVDTFLEMIATEFDEITRSHQELRDKSTELKTQLGDYKAMEKTFQQTLAHAQATSLQSVENARKEAQLMLTEAELRGAQILDKARNDLTRMKEEIAILKAKKNTLSSRLKMLLNSELQLIRALEVDEEFNPEVDDNDSTSQKEKTEIEEIIKNLDK